MIEPILRDCKNAPPLFFWSGAIPEEALDEWLSREGLRLPEDLIELWRETGGGDFFESETIVGPFGDEVLGDDVRGFNELHRSQGFPPGYLLFHGGLELSAIRLSDLKYVSFSHSYASLREFSSLEEWYENLRADFAELYGL